MSESDYRASTFRQLPNAFELAILELVNSVEYTESVMTRSSQLHMVHDLVQYDDYTQYLDNNGD